MSRPFPALALLTSVALAFGAPAASAQSFNIDFGANPAYAPVPSPSFGGEALQPGVWNTAAAAQSTLLPLVDLQGNPSGVVLEDVPQPVNPSSFDQSWDQALTGDPAALMEDEIAWYHLHTGAGNKVFRFNGLNPGSYVLYVYALDVFGDFTSVSVETSPDPVQAPYDTLTHSRHRVQVGASGAITFHLDSVAQSVCMNGLQLVQVASEHASVCAGDGTGAACPCGNFGGWSHGCASSFARQGALLFADGSASVASDTLVLHATSVSNASTTTFQCDLLPASGAGVPFNDGLYCLGGNVRRIVSRLGQGNAVTYPVAGEVPISVRGLVAPGSTLYYQLVYRNAASFCTPATQNYTNAVQVDWTP